MDSKACTRCNLIQPLSEFSPDRRKKDGLQSRCKKCNSDISREWRAKNPEAVREHSRKSYILYKDWYREYNRIHMREYRKKPEVKFKSAARRAVQYALRAGNLIRPQVCSQCNAPCKPEAHHHRGYDRPQWLDVIWLCVQCHIQLEKKNEQA